MALKFNGLDILRATIWIPWRGAWTANVELGVEDVALVPSAGSGVLLIDAATYPCTIDPRASGTFIERATLRLIGGGGGWDKEVPAQHFAVPSGGLLSSVVCAATAASVGEAVVDAAPIPLGTDFVRSKGAAMRVFGDRDWHVDPTAGVTFVGAPWVPGALNPLSDTLIDFDIASQRATITSDTLLLPGVVLVDLRLNGKQYIVRDVEQTFSHEGGNTALAWCCEKPVSRLTETIASLVREFAGTAYLKTYLYRFVLGGEQKLALQAITVGAPDLNPIAQWVGLSGAVATLAPGTEIVVGFAGGDPTQPFLVAFSPLATPLKSSVLASALATVDAPIVKVGSTLTQISGGAFPLVVAPWAVGAAAALTTLAPAITAAANAEAAAFTSLAAASVGPLAPLAPGFTAAAAGASALAAASTALGVAMATLPPPATVKTLAT